MPMSPSVARARECRRSRDRRHAAAMVVCVATIICALSWLQWDLLAPLPWYGRVAILGACWASATLLVGCGYARRFSGKPQ